MKFSNTKALTSRLLVTLTLAFVSVAGLSGLAEAATCTTCHAPVGSTTDMRPVESTWRNITTGSIVGSHAKHIPLQTVNKADCTVCHGAGVTGYTNNHTNSATDFTSAVGYSGGTSVAHSGNPVLGACASASCHVSAYNTGYITSPTWGVTTACVGCHTGVGAFTGGGSSPNTGSHTKHMAASAVCANCHTGAVAGSSGGTAHVDGNIDVTNSYTANVTKHTQGSGYSSCSTASGLACHASPYSTSATEVTTAWGTPGCAACHTSVGGFTVSNGPSTGSHTKHMSVSGTTCGSCHTGAVALSSGGTAHRDGNIDVIAYTSNVTKHAANTNYQRCSTALCHRDPYSTSGYTISPTWGVSTTCGECHVGVGAFTASGGPSTGKHTKHMAVAGATCASCHAGAVAGSSGGTAHIDHNIDVAGTAISAYTANVTKHAAGSTYTGTCSTTCHTTPYTTTAGTSPSWGAASAGCVLCHNGAGAFTGAGGVPVTGAHTKHQAAGAACNSCHAGAITGSTGGTAHFDTNIDVQGTAISNYTANVTKHASGTYVGNCTTTCHTSPYSTSAGSSPSWGTSNAGCGLCHNAVGEFTASGGPSTGSHTRHMAAAVGASCASCHTGAIAGTTGGVTHANNAVDVTGGYPLAVVKHAAGSGYSRCSSASCHRDPYSTSGYTTSPTWGVASTCGECHVGIGAFTVSGGPITGSHTKHMATAGTTCGSCHAGAVAGSTGGTGHLDSNIDVLGYATTNFSKHAANSTPQNCTTASCHRDPYSTSGYTTSPNWGTVSSCGECHVGVGAFTASSGPSTGKHTKHMAVAGATCASCHAGAVAGASGGTAHIDHNIDVTGTAIGTSYTANVTKHAAGSTYTGTCSTTCHTTPYTTTAGTSPSWGAASAGCALCHTGVGAFTATGGPSTGRHTKHMAVAGATCASCHAGAIAGTTGGAAHFDMNVDLQGTAIGSSYTANVTKHAANSTYTGTCSTTCHTTPYATTAGTSPSWGTVNPGCALCHNGVGAFTASSGPSTGKHTKHMAVAGATCASCHAGAIAGTTGGASHFDLDVDVQGTAISGYTANVSKHAAGSTYTGTCSTTCHTTPYTTVAGTSPSWGAASPGCALCHNGEGAFTASSGPSTGQHTKHMAVSGATCASCHAGAIAGTTGGAAHFDMNVDLQGTAIGSSYTANVTKHAANSTYTGTCSTTCHTTPYTTTAGTTPSWGTVGSGCALCHNAAGAFTASGGPSTGKHTRHMAVSGATCSSCHAGAIAGTTGGTAHLDTNIDVTGTAIGTSYTANVTKHAAGSTYTGTCLTTCHVTPYTTAAGTSPSWGAASTGCALCHSGVGAFTASGGPSTGKHTRHMALSGAACSSCHAGAVAGTSGGTAHADTNIDVTGTAISGYTANVTKHAAGSTYTGTCLTTCHVTPYTTAAGTSPSWGAASTGCVLCHTGVGAFTASSGPSTGQHTKHMAVSGTTCGSCHAGAVAGSSGGTAHADSNVDVTGTAISGYTANVTKHAAGSTYTGTCSTTCHTTPYTTVAGTSPSWGTTGSGCLLCHSGVGAFTGTGSSPATGRHTRHMAVDRAAPASCASCHTGAIAGSTGGSVHLDTNVDVVGTAATGYTANVTKHAAGTYTGTCIVSCHGKNLASNTTTGYPGTPSGNLTAPSWNTTFLTGAASTVGNGSSTWGSGDCAKCHGFPPMTATHAGKIATECKTCHTHVSAAGTSFDTPALHVDGTVQALGDCTGCHASVQGARMNVMLQFSTASNSHHYQGTAKISNTVCYACHWEADSAGAINPTYHGKTGASVVDLVIWNTTTRPAVYTANVTASTYLSGGIAASSRAELLKINNHCLGCHSVANTSINPFATDSRTPSTYSWEGKSTALGGFGLARSIASKYSDTTTTSWGKFTGNFNNNKSQTKAFSAHNNASNQRGWSTLAENLQSTTAVTNYPNLSGSNVVLCFDCHNSHGSSSKSPATDKTSSYDSATGVNKGGILKQTIAGLGGYTNTYTPGAAGSVAEKNQHNAGAGLCFDCHNNQNPGATTESGGSTTPWGYTGTFGSSQAIYGYNDTPYFGKTGGTFAKTLTHTYTALGGMSVNRGGHFGASATLINGATNQIGGLCTPCHDPHGVSPGISTPANSVPLLKGTYVTSPYKVDVAGTAINRGGGSKQPVVAAGFVPGYHIDQNTMQAGRTMKPANNGSWLFTTSAKSLQTLNSTQFGGLCARCHSQSTLNSTAGATSANWKSSGRIHNAVAGWAATTGTGGNLNNTKHAFTCSKCHTTHNSRLPRLLVTNCLDVKHAGRVLSQATLPAVTSPRVTTTSGGRGRFPGGGGGLGSVSTASNPGPWYFGNTTASTAAPTAATTCHNSATAGGTTVNATAQQWNTKSLW